MDEYAFLIELNSNLCFKFAGNAIAGDIGDLSFKISFLFAKFTVVDFMKVMTS